MYFVYIINSECQPDKFYIGYTLDVESRLVVHNQGGSIYTKDYRPWNLTWYCAFEEKDRVLEFEKYLKSHSGRAFAKKRLSSK